MAVEGSHHGYHTIEVAAVKTDSLDQLLEFREEEPQYPIKVATEVSLLLLLRGHKVDKYGG